MQEIAKLTGWSRNFVSELIRDNEKVKEKKNTKKVKLYKFKNRGRVDVPISVDFWRKIDINTDLDVAEFVNITVKENEKEIIIKKTEI